MEARAKCNYTIVPAIEDNADSLECFFYFILQDTFDWLCIIFYGTPLHCLTF